MYNNKYNNRAQRRNYEKKKENIDNGRGTLEQPCSVLYTNSSLSLKYCFSLLTNENILSNIAFAIDVVRNLFFRWAKSSSTKAAIFSIERAMHADAD